MCLPVQFSVGCSRWLWAGDAAEASFSLHTHIYLYISVSVHTYMDVLDGLDNCSKDEERKQRNRQSGVSGHSAGWC
jgi:hypothetical protein